MKNKGFTLIEVLIYIALSAVLMGSAFITVYQLIDGSRKLNSKNTTQEEGNFVIRKIGWALSGINPSTTPTITGAACSRSISIVKSDTSLSPIVIRLNSSGAINYIEMNKNGGTFYPITTSNVSVACLEFISLSGSPSGITATATIDGKVFNITKYIRK